MYDLVVAGGGISGAIAAISASRLGLNVLLIEKYGYLGGTLTACGTGPMMTFHAGKKQVVQGITGELMERLMKKNLSPGHIFDTTGYTYTVTPFDCEGLKIELEQMLLEAGCKLLFHTSIYETILENKSIKAIRIFNKSGLDTIFSKVFIDATGDADLTYLSNGKYNLGRTIDGKCQPVTLNVKMCNVDIEKVKQYIKNNTDEFPRLKDGCDNIDKSCRLSIGGFVKTLRQAQSEGEISFAREDILFFETNTKGEVIVNTTRVLDVDPTNAYDLTRAEIQGRQQALEIVNLLKNKVSGFENAIVEYTGPFIGVRSSRQIIGQYILTQGDLVNQKRFDDVIAHGGYPVDIHPPEGDDSNFDEEIFKTRHLPYGAFYDIPYRCLISDEINNLITVGRCISTTFEAQGSIRVSPIAGAIGHAAGVAAYVAITGNTDVGNIDIRNLQSVLRIQNAYIREV